MKDIFVYGASGHAKVVIDIIKSAGDYNITCLVDDNLELKGGEVFGYPVIGGRDELQTTDGIPAAGIVAIGDNQVRTSIYNWLTEKGVQLVCAIHKSAVVAESVRVGNGTVIMAGSIINPDSIIGNNAIINSGAVIEHDCSIGDNVHIGPNSTLCGHVEVGDNILIGAGSTVIPLITIGNNVTIGAGSTVISNIDDNCTVIGVPATPH